MPITIVCGAQYGSEGKGKVTKYFAHKQEASAVVRCGGPNSGHTVYDVDNHKLILKQLPVSCVMDGVKSVISTGSYIDLYTLRDEMTMTGIRPENLIIDPNATIIRNNHKAGEVEALGGIGSTMSGTGYALMDKIKRDPCYESPVFAENVEWLIPYLGDTKKYLNSLLNKEERIIIEGTQGYGLSLLHSNDYPYVTSRDTTAASFLSEVGLSPINVDDVVLVIRTFPIRVAGTSGPLENEIDWDILSEECGKKVIEHTSVTGKVRRVARFDPYIVMSAINANNPTKIVMNHMDYFKSVDEYVYDSKKLIHFEKSINANIGYIGIGPRIIMKI